MYPPKFELYTYVDHFPHRKSGCDITPCNALSIPTTYQASLKEKKEAWDLYGNKHSIIISDKIAIL
jgi:hypothetical protein